MVDHQQREPLIKSQVSNGQTLQGTPTAELAFGVSLAHSLENTQGQIDRRNAESDLKLGLTPVRRTFCLLSIFDALLVFLLWIMYAQIFMGGIKVTFEKQVAEYVFQTSLFDFVVLGFLRCILLLFCYAILKSSKWYMVAATTMGSTLMAILKVILKDGDVVKTGQPLSYCIVIVTFIICWAEVWHFDFQVIPTELRSRREETSNTLTGSLPTLPPSIYNWRQGAASEYQSCYSPRALTPRESDEESNSDLSDASENEHYLNPSKMMHIEQGKEAVQNLLMMLHTSENWKQEKLEDDGILVEARNFDNVGKVFRSKCIVDCDSRTLFAILWSRVEAQPSWNPTVSDCQILSKIDKKTDICYVMASEAGGGLISSRDFVNVRRYQQQGNMVILAGKATSFEAVQEKKGVIRGENGPGGYVIRKIRNKPKQCEFLWYLNTDIKGWIPKSVIDQTMAAVMVDTIRALKEFISNLK